VPSLPVCLSGTITKNCKVELLDFKVLRDTNINLNTNLGMSVDQTHPVDPLSSRTVVHLQPRPASLMPTSSATTRGSLVTSLDKW
jgi:hypothetical protein